MMKVGKLQPLFLSHSVSSLLVCIEEDTKKKEEAGEADG